MERLAAVRDKIAYRLKNPTPTSIGSSSQTLMPCACACARTCLPSERHARRKENAR